jgi:dCMP deaminase
MTRPSWSEYWLGMAQLAATRSTCKRLRVGCVLVADNQLLVSGYNGALPGAPHCLDAGCDIGPHGGCQVAHAEANAICFASRRGVAITGATCYCTHSPCAACAKLLVVAGIVSVVYGVQYRDPAPLDMLKKHGVAVVHQE